MSYDLNDILIYRWGQRVKVSAVDGSGVRRIPYVIHAGKYEYNLV
jgi:hypothetical protein